MANGGSWALSGATNDAFIVVNRLLKAGATVSRKTDGTWIIANNARQQADRGPGRARDSASRFTAGDRRRCVAGEAAPRRALGSVRRLDARPAGRAGSSSSSSSPSPSSIRRSSTPGT